ncbi:MAG: 2-hydroxyacyl-CoA dehydratase family protein [Caldisericia bacterium]
MIYKNFKDKHPEKVDLNEFSRIHREIPDEIKKGFTALKGTTEEYSYMASPACFSELEGDTRLSSLKFDNSLASIRLWSMLLSEEQRLHKSRKAGKRIIGAMKDLGTIPVIAYAHPEIISFYPDGAWWIPCVMEMNAGLLKIADGAGLGEEYCPARVALSAFLNRAHFPMPELLIGAVGSCCDDFSAVMSRISRTDMKVSWWELPYRRETDSKINTTELSTGIRVENHLIDFVEEQFKTIIQEIKNHLGLEITDEMLTESIKNANRLRKSLANIRDMAYGITPAPLPSLEAQICEMFALHYCSDMEEGIDVIEFVEQMVIDRVENNIGILPEDNAKILWVNPVADLRIMNIFEDLGGRVAGSEYLFSHSLTQIPEDTHPTKALAMIALCDPMIGSSRYRAKLICDEIEKYDSEGVLISDIPGASHCATEGHIIKEEVQKRFDIPVLNITIPPLADSSLGQLSTRISAFIEIIKARREK